MQVLIGSSPSIVVDYSKEEKLYSDESNNFILNNLFRFSLWNYTIWVIRSDFNFICDFINYNLFLKSSWKEKCKYYIFNFI